MREHDLQPKQRRRFVATTDSDHDEPIFSNLAADMVPDGPDQLWAADLTYVAIASRGTRAPRDGARARHRCGSRTRARDRLAEDLAVLDQAIADSALADPAIKMATTARNRRLEPCYKQHAVVDDVRGVIVDVEVTTGEVNEGQLIEERVDATMVTTGIVSGRPPDHARRARPRLLAQAIHRSYAVRTRVT